MQSTLWSCSRLQISARLAGTAEGRKRSYSASNFIHEGGGNRDRRRAVPLTGENRVFAKLGLEALRSAVNPGLKALLEVAQLGGRPLTSGEVAFRIAPRMNAAGRMDVARDVVELFSVKDPERAREIANRLDQLNAERQEEERRILEAIQLRLDEDASLKDAFCLVIDGDGWHRGVIGITATRVVERYGRPALVVSRDGEEAHGSGRSIAPFHLLNRFGILSRLVYTLRRTLPCSRFCAALVVSP